VLAEVQTDIIYMSPRYARTDGEEVGLLLTSKVMEIVHNERGAGVPNLVV
jgi:hypothetical protein